MRNMCGIRNRVARVKRNSWAPEGNTTEMLALVPLYWNRNALESAVLVNTNACLIPATVFVKWVKLYNIYIYIYINIFVND